jgi:hypothetical protein
VMSVQAFRQEIDRHGPFHDLINRYVQALTAMIMQSTACNGLHSVEERCARWLLMTHDRVGQDEFRLTQEFLAIMLGVRRPSVTIVMGTLHKAGVIDYRNRMTRVLDRTVPYGPFQSVLVGSFQVPPGEHRSTGPDVALGSTNGDTDTAPPLETRLAGHLQHRKKIVDLLDQRIDLIPIPDP